ncbi:hypothetical protein ABID19_005729 [Mesorhizobium robiniae]|uniref:Uncharacterized protein n=1 Tax=Mesorhizobium robiniae TaxID=559315 RepID=A0ABV2GXB5_9HYPH
MARVAPNGSALGRGTGQTKLDWCCKAVTPAQLEYPRTGMERIRILVPERSDYQLRCEVLKSLVGCLGQPNLRKSSSGNWLSLENYLGSARPASFGRNALQRPRETGSMLVSPLSIT